MAIEAIKSFPRYERYKDSGVEWIGEIPEHWDVLRLGSFFEERREIVSDVDYPPLSVTMKGIVPQLESAAKSQDGNNRKLVCTGDFVINSRSDRKGSSGVSPLDGSVSLINIVLKPNGISPSYTNYLLKSYTFIEEYYRIGRGIVADLWTTRYSEMKNIMVSFPPVIEQTAIAQFLDHKTAQIDRAIAIKEAQIALLNERKQIMIQEAVTKGLDPTVPMKDSGVEWIGEIPAHWEVKKLKYFGSIKSGDGITNSELKEQGVYEVFGGNGFMGYSDKYNIIGEKLIIGRVGAYCGNVRYVNEKKWISDNALVLNLRSGMSFEYIKYVLESFNLNKLNTSNAQPLITGSKVMNVALPLPTERERKKILEFIYKNDRKIIKAILSLKNQIQTLKEYKTTLINEAVTGKIKIN
mgnify:CR=1 FL=1